MKTLAITMLVCVAFGVSACGGGYTAPAKGNTKPRANSKAGPKTPENKPTGPSMAAEYEKEMLAAFAAHDEYEKVKRDTEARKEPYVKWAVHMYAALAYANDHANNGHSKDNLPRFKSLKELKSGYFKNALGPLDDPRVKEALKKWQDSTS